MLPAKAKPHARSRPGYQSGKETMHASSSRAHLARYKLQPGTPSNPRLRCPLHKLDGHPIREGGTPDDTAGRVPHRPQQPDAPTTPHHSQAPQYPLYPINPSHTSQIPICLRHPFWHHARQGGDPLPKSAPQCLLCESQIRCGRRSVKVWKIVYQFVFCKKLRVESVWHTSVSPLVSMTQRIFRAERNKFGDICSKNLRLTRGA